MSEVTIPQWAAQLGISKQAAYKRVKSGKVKRNRRGLIDTESAEAQWAANKDALQEQRGAPKHSTAASPQSGSSGRAFTPFENRSSLAEAQRAREWLRVKKEKLTVELLERPSRASAGHSPTWSAELRILESGQAGKFSVRSNSTAAD